MATKLIGRYLPILIMVGFFVLWQLVCVIFRVEKFILPSPVDIWYAFIRYHDAVLWNALHTLIETLIGFVMAVAFGLVLGTLVGILPKLYAGLYPLVVGMNSVPKVAVVPILVIWVGIGTVPAVITAFLTAFFPVMINVATGLSATDPELTDVLRSVGGTQFQILRKVSFPQAMPYFFASLKLAVTLAFIGAIVSESIASSRGIGYLMISASSRFEVPLVFAGLLVIGIMGVVLYQCFAFIEQRVTFWAARGAAAG